MARRFSSLAFVLALASAGEALATNRLVNWDFESTNEPGNSWPAGQTGAQTATQDSFGRAAGGYNSSANAFWGAWSSTGKATVTAHRYITQDYTPPAGVNARLTVAYKRTGSGSSISWNLRIGVNSLADAYNDSTAGADAQWQTASKTFALLNQSYTVEVEWSVTFNGSSAASQGAWVDNIALNISPSGLSASAVTGSSNVQLIWTPSGGSPAVRSSQGYHIYRGGNSLGETALQYVDGTPWIDTSTDGNIDYYYQLSDLDTDPAGPVESPVSMEAHVLTAPGVPTGMTFSNVDFTSMTVNWVEPKNGAFLYRLERADDSSGTPGAWSEVWFGGTNWADDLGLSCGNSYWYRVHGTNTSGAGATSTPVLQAAKSCPQTVIGDGVVIDDSQICPKLSGFVDAFTANTTAQNDRLTGVTVQLSPSAAAWFSKVEVTDDLGTAQGSVDPGAGDPIVVPVNLDLDSNIHRYRLRLTAKPGAQLQPGVFGTTGSVVDVTSVNNNSHKVLGDLVKTVLTVDHQPPAEAVWATVTPGDRQVALSWLKPNDGDFKDVLVVRSNAPIDASVRPVDGADYNIGGPLSGTVVACVAGTSCTDNSLTNGTDYYYKIFTRDNCGNWSNGAALAVQRPNPVITVGDGSKPKDSTVCPGASPVDLDSFTLRSSLDPDGVSGVTVTLSAGSAAAVKRLELTSDDGKTSYGAIDSPPTDTFTLPISPSIQVGGSDTAYRLKLSAQGFAALAPSPGKLYPITGTVSGITTAHNVSLNDTSSATVTVDDQGPASPSWSAILPDDQAIALSWSMGAGESVIVVRDLAPVATSPAAGATYQANDPFGATGTVVYAGNAKSFNDTGLTNKTPYYYALFSADSCGNWSPAALTGPHTPGPVVTLVADRTNPPDAGLCPAGDAVQVDSFSVRTSRKTDVLTGFTIALAKGVADSLARVEIAQPDGTVLGSLVPDGSSDSVDVMLDKPLDLTTAEIDLVVNVAARARADIPAAGPTAVTALVAHAIGVLAESISDTDSATLTLLAARPAAPAPVSAKPGESQVVLSWQVPALAKGSVLARAASRAFTDPADGATVQQNQLLGQATVLEAGLVTAHQDLSLVDGTAYYYAVWDWDECLAYSAAAIVGPVVPGPATLLVDDGVEDPDGSLCPGAQAMGLDAFTLATSSDTAVVNAITVTLSPGAVATLRSVEITSDDGATLLGSAEPASDDVTVALDPPIQLSTTPVAYRVRVVPRSFGELTAQAAKSLEITGKVTAVQSPLTASISDATSARLVLDLEPPLAPTAASAVVKSSSVTVSWTNSTSADQSGALALRGAEPITDAPVRGVSYSAGDSVGSSKVAWVGTSASFTEATPPAKTGWALFAHDKCGNWSQAVVVALPRAPDAGAFEQPSYELGGCGCQQAAAPLGVAALLAFTLLALARPRRRA